MCSGTLGAPVPATCFVLYCTVQRFNLSLRSRRMPVMGRKYQSGIVHFSLCNPVLIKNLEASTPQPSCTCTTLPIDNSDTTTTRVNYNGHFSHATGDGHTTRFWSCFPFRYCLFFQYDQPWRTASYPFLPFDSATPSTSIYHTGREIIYPKASHSRWTFKFRNGRGS